MNAQNLKGFRDFLPTVARKREYALRLLKEVFSSYGFEPLETPALEYEEVLIGKYGKEGDKLMYRFEDNGKRKVAMRYDQTVPLARVVAQYKNDIVLPFKRYQIQPVWRAENTQKGRYREFLQVDLDTVGSSSPLSDAEILEVAGKSFEKLGIKNYKILINDRKNFDEISNEAIVAIDKLKKIGPDGVENELIKQGFSDQDARILLDELIKAPQTERINKILSKLSKELSEKIEYEPTLARGLDYYTGMIFEIEISEYDGGSVAGGGRYDDLVGMFAGESIPAVGFAIGFDRLMEALESLSLFPEDLGSAKILVTNTSDRSLKIADGLRKKKISTELYIEEKDLDKQLKYADRRGIPYVLITKDNLVLKNMKTGEQKEVKLEELPDAIR